MTGFHSRGALLAAGWTDDEIRNRLRSRTWRRIAIGRYLTAPTDRLSPEAAHALVTRATLSRFSSAAVMAGHVSAAALHRLPVVGVALQRVEVVRHGSSGSRSTRTSRVRACLVPAADRTMVDGTPTTTVARTLVDLARSAPRVTAVVAADHALHNGLVRPAEVVAALGRIRSGPRLPHARRTLRLVDGRAESPGESAMRVALRDGGLTGLELHGLELQLTIHDERGRFAARVDAALEEAGVVLEFDGHGKYTAPPGAGESPGRVVLREKLREDRIRGLGWEVVRFDWSDLADPPAMVRRVLAAARRATGRPYGSVVRAAPLPIEGLE